MVDYRVYNKKYLLGDIHEYWNVIANHVVHNNEQNIAYIQVGDFGIGMGPFEREMERLTELNEILNEYKSDLFIMRGNHDDPKWFIDENFTVIKDKLNRIFFVPDFTVINMDLENILFVGGAVSVDRVPNRIKPFDCWWEDEVFVLDKDRLNQFEDINRVITHTAPDFCAPIAFNQTVYRFAKNDPDLIKDLVEERKKLTEMASTLMFNGKNPNLKYWAYGHFHRHNLMVHNNVTFEEIDINQFIQF